MCGILGGINIQIDKPLLDLIGHRGPDRQDIKNFHCMNRPVSFAHTRLSIVDLSDAGNQPMSSACGNYEIIFNGEIYNHLDLRSKLKKTDYKGHSDTETILYYIIEYGIASIKDFNGIFAFTFIDKIKGILYLARDKYGVKPVYHYCDGNKLLFSSEIRPINKILNSVLDSVSLNLLLNLRYCPSPSTLFKDVFKLRPGHYAEIVLNKAILELNIKSFISSETKQLDISYPEAVKEYGNLLEKAIERQLMSDVEVGILLSGGIDSAMVAGIAAKKLSYKPKAFTVGFGSEYTVNEIGAAKETADHFGLEHHVTRVESSDFFDIFEKCSGIVEEPLATTSFIPMYYLAELASKSVKVVLTGQGADEPLGGYGRYQGEVIRDRYPKILLKLAAAAIKLSGTKKERLLRGANSINIADDIQRFVKAYSIFDSNEIRLLTGNENTPSAEYIKYYYDLLNCKAIPKSAERMMALDKYMDLSDDLLLYTDKITMNFSLECRVPMLDLELVDFLAGLPTDYKVKRGRTKIIHKEYAKQFLPASIINRPKFGFQSPTDIWFRESSGRLREMLLSDDNKLLNYLNRNEIEKLLVSHNKGFNKEKQIFLLLGLYYWLKGS
jgi:asparagine synthase (glutamine-hydrolysing)